MAFTESAGTIMAVSTDGGSTWENLCFITDIPGPSGTRSLLDQTTICDTVKTKMVGAKEYDDLALTGYFDATNSGYQDVSSLWDSGDEANWRITMLDASGTVLTFTGHVSGFGKSFAMDELIGQDFTITLSSDVTET